MQDNTSVVLSHWCGSLTVRTQTQLSGHPKCTRNSCKGPAHVRTGAAPISSWPSTSQSQPSTKWTTLTIPFLQHLQSPELASDCRSLFMTKGNYLLTRKWSLWDFSKHSSLICWISRRKHIIANINALLSKSPDLSTCKSRDLNFIVPKLAWLKQSLQKPSTSDTSVLFGSAQAPGKVFYFS